jgi:Family of unknown function (DUF6535)
VQSSLQPDNSATTVTLLKILIHKIDNSTFPDISSTVPEWIGPNSSMVAVQTLLCSSLVATLFAAFLGMQRKQWISRYGEGSRGTSYERCRERQQKLDGIKKWKFYVIVEGMPFMLYIGLLLLGIALSRYMWDISRSVAGAIIGITSFGILFYVCVLFLATLVDYSPFQTSLSRFLSKLLRYMHDLRSWSYEDAHKCVVYFVYCVMEKLRPANPNQHPDPSSANVDRLFDGGDVGLARNNVDARCVMWLRETYVESESGTAFATMRFIPEVEWNADVDIVPPMLELATKLREYCGLMHHVPATFDNTKKNAYATAKALLHLYVQRRCVNGRELPQLSQEIYFGTHEGIWDNELESTLWMIDHIILGNEQIIWPKFNDDTEISTPHLSWISHVLLYHMWASRQQQIKAPVDLDGLDKILAKIWSCRKSLSLSTVADCIMIRCLTLGMQIHVRDLSAIDRKSAFLSSSYSLSHVSIAA